MSESEGNVSGQGGLFTFFLIVTVLGLAWYQSGGVNRASSQNPFLHPPAPLGSGGTYGLSFLDNVVNSSGSSGGLQSETSYQGSQPEFNAKLAELSSAGSASPYRGQVYFSNTSASVGVDDVTKEFVTIIASSRNNAPLNLSGWRLKSAATNSEASIGTGVRVFYSSRDNGDEAILLNPGEYAVISTGRSPAGESFRLNKCSGYLAQFQHYEPQISTASCPNPLDETRFAKLGAVPSDSCLSYLKTLYACTAPITTSLPQTITGVCSTFIADTLNYNSCVDHHRTDSDFFGNGGWRIYLDRNLPLWKKQRETIELLDQNGKVVDLYSYGYGTY